MSLMQRRSTLVSSELAIHPELEVTLADYTWLPTSHSAVFQTTLEKEEGLALIHFAAEVDRCSLGGGATPGGDRDDFHPSPSVVIQQRIVVMSQAAVYLCTERSEIARCIPLELIEEVFIVDDWICIGVPSQYDLVFKISSRNLNTNCHQSFFLETMNVLRMKLLGPHHRYPVITPITLPTFDAMLRRPLARSQGQGGETRPIPIPIAPWAELVTYPRCDVIIRSLRFENAEKCSNLSPVHQRQYRDEEMAGFLQAKNQSPRSRGRNEPNYEEDLGYASPTSPTGRRRYKTLKAINEVLEKDITAAAKWKNINEALSDPDSPIRQREQGKFLDSPKRRIQAAVPRRKEPLDSGLTNSSPPRVSRHQTASPRAPRQQQVGSISSAKELKNFDFNEEVAPVPAKYLEETQGLQDRQEPKLTVRSAKPYQISPNRVTRYSPPRRSPDTARDNMVLHNSGVGDSPLPYSLRQEGVVTRKSPATQEQNSPKRSRSGSLKREQRLGDDKDLSEVKTEIKLVWEELKAQRQTLGTLSDQMNTMLLHQQQTLSKEAAAVIHGDEETERRWGAAVPSSTPKAEREKIGIRAKRDEIRPETSTLTPFQRKLVGRQIYGPSEGDRSQKESLEKSEVSTELQFRKLEQGFNSPTEPKVSSTPTPTLSEGRLHRRVASPYQAKSTNDSALADNTAADDDDPYWTSLYLSMGGANGGAKNSPPRAPTPAALVKQPHHLTGTRTTRAQEMRSLHNQVTYGGGQEHGELPSNSRKPAQPCTRTF